MKAKITRIPESPALILDDAVLKEFGLEDNMEVELSSSGESVLMTPVRHDQLRKILDEMHEEYGNVFRRLAE